MVVQKGLQSKCRVDRAKGCLMIKLNGKIKANLRSKRLEFEVLQICFKFHFLHINDDNLLDQLPHDFAES